MPVMLEVDYARLQEQYGGRYVAERDGTVVASAETYDALIDALEAAKVDRSELVIEYVEPADTVCVY